MCQHNVIINTNVRILVRHAETDEVIKEMRVHNLVTDSGLNKLRDMIGYPYVTCDGKTPDYMAVGTSSTAPAADQTALITEVFRTKLANRVPDTKSIAFYAYISPTEANGNTLREVGLFTEISAGELWARAVHTAIAKTVSLSFTYEWTFTFAAA